MILGYSSNIDNKCPNNLETVRGEDELEGELKSVREEKVIAAAHTNNIS